MCFIKLQVNFTVCYNTGRKSIASFLGHEIYIFKSLYTFCFNCKMMDCVPLYQNIKHYKVINTGENVLGHNFHFLKVDSTI